MTSLTAAEKSHWRDRIAARIDRLIEAARARDPEWFDRIARAAYTQAVNSLGLNAPHLELKLVKLEIAAQGRVRRDGQRLMISILRSIPIVQVPDDFPVDPDSDLALPTKVAEAIARRQAVFLRQVMAADPAGREIIRLEAKKEDLLDSVWLAVAPAPIKQLWAKVGELLGDDRTSLEREALTIEAPEET